jgi:hypothetical protein
MKYPGYIYLFRQKVDKRWLRIGREMRAVEGKWLTGGGGACSFCGDENVPKLIVVMNTQLLYISSYFAVVVVKEFEFRTS